jgi:3-methyladenine DNA glycosylase/8-oxoguanine DNA glycosylase
MEVIELLQLPQGALREAGLSLRKVEYVEGLAQAMTEGRFDPSKLPRCVASVHGVPKSI